MTLRELQKCCKYWQKILKIQDIDITVTFTPYKDLDNSLGSTTTRSDCTAALVEICPETDFPPESLAINDEELTLVHELLHVQWRFLGACSAFQKLMEENDSASNANELAIEHTAQALLSLKREMERWRGF